MCVQEEDRLSMEEGEKVAPASSSKNKRDHIKEKGKIPVNQVKVGHTKKDCIKFKAWLKKKESNMVNVNHDTWWIDAGTTIHISNTLQDSCIFRKFEFIGCGILSDKLFHLGLCIMNEDFSMLWHQRLGHIYIERVKRLVKEGILSTLDFTDFDTCVSCIKGKQTNKHKIGAKRKKKLDPRTISWYFIGSATMIVESRDAKFLENDLISGSGQFQEINHGIDHHEVPHSDSSDRFMITKIAR
ncbi:hypothetical protein V2J09_009406 [Rumex salicifolius]